MIDTGPKFLRSTIPNPVYDFKVKVTDLEFLLCNFLQFHFFRKAFNGFNHLWHEDRAFS